MVPSQSADLEALALLLSAGADPNSERGSDGASALHLAIDQGEDYVRRLLQAKADCNLQLCKEAGKGSSALRWRGSATPLHQACMVEDASVSERLVALLLDADVDINVKNRENKSAMQITRHVSVGEMIARHGQERLAAKKKQSSPKPHETTLKIGPVGQGTAKHVANKGPTLFSHKKEAGKQATRTAEERIQALHAWLESEAASIVMPEEEVEARSKPSVKPRDDECAAADGPVESPESGSAGNDQGETRESVAEEHRLVPRAGTRQAREGKGEVTTSMDQPADMFKDLRFSSEDYWDLRITREFKESLFALHHQPHLLKSLVGNLGRLARGERGRNLYKQLTGVPKSLRIYESPVKTWNDGGRFLWQFSVDYSPRIRTYTDCIRLWRLCLQHDDVPKGIEFIVESHKRGRTSTVKKGLKSSFRSSTLQPDGRRVPRHYDICKDMDMDDLIAKDKISFDLLTKSFDTEDEDDVHDADDHQAQVLFTPPAIKNNDCFNVLKFYQLGDEVLQSLRQFEPVPPKNNSSAVAVPDFPFIPDDCEDMIINKDRELGQAAKASTLLVGRSGTGKTSIAVGRLWSLYKHTHSGTWQGGKYNQIFVTANKVLRGQVRKSFQGQRFVRNSTNRSLVCAPNCASEDARRLLQENIDRPCHVGRHETGLHRTARDRVGVPTHLS